MLVGDSAALLTSAVWRVLFEQGLRLPGLDESMAGDAYRLVMIAGFAGLTLLGALSWRAGLRRLRLDAQTRKARDPRAPILLRRSFEDDAIAVRPTSLLGRLQPRKIRVEEAVAKEMSKYGPFVAIGAPGESLPQLGAHRACFSDDDWQAAVLRWTETARLVAMVAGSTSWVRWELTQMLRSGMLGKLLLLLPPVEPTELQARWGRICECFEGTDWHPALLRLDVGIPLAVRFSNGGDLVVFTGNRRSRERFQPGGSNRILGHLLPQQAVRTPAGAFTGLRPGRDKASLPASIRRGGPARRLPPSGVQRQPSRIPCAAAHADGGNGDRSRRARLVARACHASTPVKGRRARRFASRLQPSQFTTTTAPRRACSSSSRPDGTTASISATW